MSQKRGAVSAGFGGTIGCLLALAFVGGVTIVGFFLLCGGCAMISMKGISDAERMKRESPASSGMK